MAALWRVREVKVRKPSRTWDRSTLLKDTSVLAQIPLHLCCANHGYPELSYALILAKQFIAVSYQFRGQAPGLT